MENFDKTISERIEFLRNEFCKYQDQINFQSIQIDDLECVELAILLYENRFNIKTFNIEDNCITDEGLLEILPNLVSNTNLEVFKVGYNNISEISINAFIEIINCFPNIKQLGFQSCGFNNDNMINLCMDSEVEFVSKEKVLNIQDNFTDDTGLYCLGFLLQSNQIPLRILNLAQSEVENFAVFFNSLFENQYLESIDVSKNKLSDDDLKVLGQLLSCNKKLTSIYLNSCNIHDSNLETLLKQIDSHCYFQNMQLNDNYISNSGVLLMIDLIEKNPSVLQISFEDSNVEIDDDIILELNDITTQNNLFKKTIFDPQYIQKKFDNLFDDQNDDDEDIDNEELDEIQNLQIEIEKQDQLINQQLIYQNQEQEQFINQNQEEEQSIQNIQYQSINQDNITNNEENLINNQQNMKQLQQQQQYQTSLFQQPQEQMIMITNVKNDTIQFDESQNQNDFQQYNLKPLKNKNIQIEENVWYWKEFKMEDGNNLKGIYHKK